MSKDVSPSTPITEEQLGKIADLVKAQIRKLNLPSDASQQVIESQGKAIALATANDFRARVEAFSNMIVRHVRVDRSRPPQQVLDATDRRQYTDSSVVKNMPKGTGEETDVCFFKLSRSISDADLEKEYALRGLIPADPYSQAQVNIDDPSFADEHPNGTHWQDANGNWCFAAFVRWDDERAVNVRRCDDDWLDRWWFAGLRK